MTSFDVYGCVCVCVCVCVYVRMYVYVCRFCHRSVLFRCVVVSKMDRQQEVINTLKFKKWALMDIEYIQSSYTHKCIRKLYVLTGDGKWDMEVDFYPCVSYHSLPDKYQRSFQYCAKHIHKLSYRPKTLSHPCISALDVIRNFINEHDVEVVLYKGGTIERDICEKLLIESRNIEAINGLRKIHSHDPATEVNLYWDQLREFTLNLFPEE